MASLVALGLYAGLYQDLIKPLMAWVSTIEQNSVQVPKQRNIKEQAEIKQLRKELEALVASRSEGASTIRLENDIRELKALIERSSKERKLLSQTKPVAQMASEKDIVAKIQRELLSLNCTSGVVDGVFGPSTSRALVKFGEANQFDTKRHHGESYNEILQIVRRRPRSSCFELSSTKITFDDKRPRHSEQTSQRSLRYLDSEGCLREPDGSMVIGFKPDECI